MRKHIGTKVVTLIALLMVLFVVSATLSGFSAKQTLASLTEVGNYYLAVEEENTNMATIVGEIRLYSNIMALTQDDTTLTAIAKQVAPPVIENMDATFTRMEELLAEMNDEDLEEALIAYKEECLKRLYESVPQRVTKEELLQRVENGKITKEEYEYIVSE